MASLAVHIPPFAPALPHNFFKPIIIEGNNNVSRSLFDRYLSRTNDVKIIPYKHTVISPVASQIYSTIHGGKDEFSFPRRTSNNYPEVLIRAVNH
jgi:hypothetical protein